MKRNGICKHAVLSHREAEVGDGVGGWGRVDGEERLWATREARFVDWVSRDLGFERRGAGGLDGVLTGS